MKKKESFSASEEKIVNYQPSLHRTHRHSLQQNRTETDLPPADFRHTQSHRYHSEGKRKPIKTVILPSIPSAISENSEEEVIVDEKSQKVMAKVENGSRSSKTSTNNKSSLAFDNLAYDSNLDKRSIGSRAGSSRQPSLQSLEVVREQYCCCARKTKCERRLLIAVAIMSIIIIVLIIVLVVVATTNNEQGLKFGLNL
ncbi:uncharacterized protein [Leptinotarsa decemlineata]|uniref:uncharacterized protein n=1 Tax=Leptinotarsa decemlineata TaxID=7539 RepID=UPI003D3077E0